MASAGLLLLLAFGRQREVDHHDGVLLHDANQQDDADNGDNIQIDVEEHQGQHGADAGRGQGRNDGQRMDEALVEDAKDDVDGEQRGGDEDRLAVKRFLIGLQRAGEEAVDGVGCRGALRIC